MDSNYDTNSLHNFELKKIVEFYFVIVFLLTHISLSLGVIGPLATTADFQFCGYL